MKHSLDELRHKVSELAIGRGDPEDLEAAIRRSIRDANADPETVTRLRMLLGELFAWMNDPAKARAQYRKILEQDPGSTGAMIGIGHTFQFASRLRKAAEWFHAAYVAAEGRQDCAGQLAALDVIALNADLRDDAQALSDALSRMCGVLASAPRVDGMHTMIAEWLIMKNKGAAALPFLECLVKHLLERGYPRSYQYLALRPFVEVQRQEGRSDEEISSLLNELRRLAADRAVARDLDIAAAWACDHGRCHYELGGD